MDPNNIGHGNERHASEHVDDDDAFAHSQDSSMDPADRFDQELTHDNDCDDTDGPTHRDTVRRPGSLSRRIHVQICFFHDGDVHVASTQAEVSPTQ